MKRNIMSQGKRDGCPLFALGISKKGGVFIFADFNRNRGKRFRE